MNVVKCAACGQSNRVPDLATGKKAVCGSCGQQLETAAGKPVVLTDETFAEFIGRGAPVVVDFWAAWCGPCRMVAPVLEELAASRSDVAIAKVDVDANPRTAAQYRVSSIPTMVYFGGGVEKGRTVGALGRPQIEQAIRTHLGR
jgi:thioredoxin 2